MKKIASIILVFISFNLAAQELHQGKLAIGFSSCYATYNQNDLKKINQDMKNQLPFDSKVIDKFEPTINFGAYAQYRLFDRFFAGPTYQYNYTGSRLGQKDYSGTYSFDQYLNSSSIGLKMDYIFIQKKYFSLGVQLNSGVSFTHWKTDSKLEISSVTSQNIEKLKGTTWYVLPALEPRFRIVNHLSLGASAGYSFDLIKKFNFLTESYTEIVRTPDWSGIRLCMSLEFDFF
jgi:hypothetical protein